MKLKTLLLAIGVVLTSAQTVAADGLLRGKVGISNNSFDSIWSGGDMSADYQALNVGLTYVTSNMYYADLGLKKSLGTDWEYSDEIGSIEEDYDRTDYTLTLGKVLNNGIQVFAGYQNSSATMDLPPEFFSVPDEKIKISGFFAGIGKSFSFENSSFNINFAIGKMDGKLTDAQGIENDSGDGSGNSFGATYTYFLSDSSTVSLEFKQQKYTYTYDNSDIILTAGDDKVSMLGINYNRTF